MKRIILLCSALLALAELAGAQTTGPINITAQDAGNCATANACAEFQIGTGVSLAVDVSGTFSATLTFEGSANNRTSWRTITVTNPADLTTATTTTAAGTFVITNNGFTHVRLRAGTYASGTAVIYGTVGRAGMTRNAPINLGSSVSFGTQGDTFLVREGAGHLMQRNSTTAQRFSVCGTYTSATNYECTSMDYQTTTNVQIFGTRTAATGTSRPLRLVSQAASASNDAAGMVFQTDSNTRPAIRLGRYSLTTAEGSLAGNSSNNTEWVRLGEATSILSSGTLQAVTVTPTYNQTATAAGTDLLVNRTETAIGSGAQYLLDLSVAGTPRFSITNRGTVALRNKCTVTVDGATTFALSNTAGCSYIDLQCTGAETINTITGAVTGTLLWLLNGDTECTIADDDVATAANAIDLTGTGTNDVGAVAKIIGLIYDGASWMQLFESDN